MLTLLTLTSVSCSNLFQDILTEFLLKIREGGNGNNMFTMDDLFYQLQVGAQNLEDATIVQDFIREIWKENPNCE